MKPISLFLMVVCVVSAGWSQIKIACVGNSITAGEYPAMLQTLLGSGYLVQNDGKPGAALLKTSNDPYWNVPQFKDVFTFKPAIITIKLGTNDSKPGNW